MADGSSIRIKAAQYVVNKKLQQLHSNVPQIRVDDWTFLQSLSQVDHILDDPASELDPAILDIPQLPPLFPTPIDNHVSWKDLLEFERQRRIPSEPTSYPDQPKLPLRFPSWYKVAIIGAGVAGLRTAKLLQDMGIPYKIFEASDRPGGRIFTYQFASKPPGNPQGKHDYYDVGAMRFPDNVANERTFALFKELDLKSKVIEYVLSTEDNIRYYNNIKTTAKMASTKGDHFEDKAVPKEFFDKQYVDLRGDTVYAVDACTAAAYDPFRKALIEDFDKGWALLMQYDWASTRSYLSREKSQYPQYPQYPHYPSSVVHWMETRNSGTGGFNKAFSEEILESLEFDDPTKDVQWRCLEGGSRVLIDAMLATLTVKPSYGHRVTAVTPLYQSAHQFFPDLPRWPRWPHFPFMQVSVSGKAEEYFSHVVSTVTFANLRTINTEQVPMTYMQRQAMRTLSYGAAVKVGIKFKSRWWEKNGLNQFGGSSYTDRQCRVVVYPSQGRGEEGPGILMVTYSWDQDASRLGALIQNPDWSKQQLDPDRKRPWSEQILLDQLYADLAALHGVDEGWLREETLDYHAFDWYHNPYTMGPYAFYGPGQFSTFFPDIVQPAGHGRFHFAGEVASTHHAWVAGALDSAVRVVDEIIRWDFPFWLSKFKNDHGKSLVFSDDESAEAHFVRGLFSEELSKKFGEVGLYT